MLYKKLGNSDIEVSALCVGCMSFGQVFENFLPWVLNYEESKRIIDHALDLGINFFDTANTYSHGTSEQFLGKALAHVPRDKVIIASKVYFNEGKLSKKAILREIDLSLKNLQTDYLDLYIIHRFDYETSIEETMCALDSLVKAGKVRALGASAMYAYQFISMQQFAKENNLTQFVSMQNHYNLLYREEEREMIPWCKQTNVALTPYSPLASGRLSRLVWESKTKRFVSDKIAALKYDSTKDSDAKIVEHVAQIAAKYNVSMTNVALAWLQAKGVCSIILGSTSIAQYDDAVKSLELKLTKSDIEYLEQMYMPHKVMGAK